METTHLSLVPASGTTIESAIDVLKKSGRSALVADYADYYRLLYWRHLLEGRQRQYKFVAQIEDGDQIHLLAAADMTLYALDLVRPLRTRVEYMDFFRAQPAVMNFALAGVTDAAAFIVTRSETLKADLEDSTGGFQCDGLNTHYFPNPYVQVGDVCPRYPLKCKRADGGKPMISAC